MADKENHQNIEYSDYLEIQSDIHFPSTYGSLVASIKNKNTSLSQSLKSEDTLHKPRHGRNVLGNIDANIQHVSQSQDNIDASSGLTFPVQIDNMNINSNESDSREQVVISRISMIDPLCKLIVSKYNLEHILDLSDESITLDILFKNIESKGLLTIQMISDFAFHITLTSLNLSPSFSSHSTTDIHFLTTSNLKDFPSSNLTKSFFQNKDLFLNLKILDLTRIPIDDDSLRYLIRLESLEALGLSGTKITTLGIKYLAKHASFKSIIKCLKLCYLENIQDDCIQYLLSFVKLQDLDLLGSDNITLKGLFGLIDIKREEHANESMISTSWKLPLKLLRVPQTVYSTLLSLHSSYHMLRSQTLFPTFQLADQPHQVKSMSRQELMEQLKIHRNYYPNIYTNLQREDLLERLHSILISRMKEECLWSLL